MVCSSATCGSRRRRPGAASRTSVVLQSAGLRPRARSGGQRCERRCCETSGARGPLPGAPEASLGRGAVLPSRPAGQVGWGSTMGQPAARPPQTGTRDAAQRSPARVGTPKQGPGSRAALIVSGTLISDPKSAPTLPAGRRRVSAIGKAFLVHFSSGFSSVQVQFGFSSVRVHRPVNR